MEFILPTFVEEVSHQATKPDRLTEEFIRNVNSAKEIAELNNYKQNTEERKKYANLIYQYTCFWSMFIGVVVIGCGAGKLHLSDLVITTLIGSTTVTLTGFFYLVTQYLFNKDKAT